MQAVSISIQGKKQENTGISRGRDLKQEIRKC